MLEILSADENLGNFGLIDILEDFIKQPQNNQAVEECSTFLVKYLMFLVLDIK